MQTFRNSSMDKQLYHQVHILDLGDGWFIVKIQGAAEKPDSFVCYFILKTVRFFCRTLYIALLNIQDY